MFTKHVNNKVKMTAHKLTGTVPVVINSTNKHHQENTPNSFLKSKTPLRKGLSVYKFQGPHTLACFLQQAGLQAELDSLRLEAVRVAFHLGKF
jgi:hypothetical protein